MSALIVRERGATSTNRFVVGELKVGPAEQALGPSSEQMVGWQGLNQRNRLAAFVLRQVLYAGPDLRKQCHRLVFGMIAGGMRCGRCG